MQCLPCYSFIERNWDHLKVVWDIVLVCAKHDIPLSEYRETADGPNKGKLYVTQSNISRSTCLSFPKVGLKVTVPADKQVPIFLHTEMV